MVLKFYFDSFYQETESSLFQCFILCVQLKIQIYLFIVQDDQGHMSRESVRQVSLFHSLKGP